jgi:hypothetical protein
MTTPLTTYGSHVRRPGEWGQAILTAALLAAAFLAAIRSEASLGDMRGSIRPKCHLKSFLVEDRETIVSKQWRSSVESFNHGCAD